MIKYQLVADSACDLNSQLEKEIPVQLIPFRIDIGDKNFIDDKNLNLKKMIKEMKAYKHSPATACPPPEEFKCAFEQHDVSFCITISSKLSGTYNSAMVARDMVLAQYPDKFIHIFDSESAGVGETLIALKIREAAEHADTPQQVVDKVEAFITEMKTYFILESLDNLMKNGRLTKVAAHLATVLSLRPIMGDDGHGNIKLYEKPRGEERAFARLFEMLGEYCQNQKDRLLGISHCCAEGKAMKLKKMLEDMYHMTNIFIVPTKGLTTIYANTGGIILVL